ncbi:hypothetical protein [Brachybacterium sp. YJGR34]|uniref:hypothetical protein n=1 Tax=Brachybacterium sp. YJGR34 TaxID=2059911 RepID=UPI00130098FB|nr:hypothetical protein [Brachybacterium sp. YJGR34]
MSIVLLIPLGLVLCFAGGASVRLSVLLAGFAAGWLLASVLGADTLLALLVALAGAVAARVAVRVLSTSVFAVAGVIVGAVVGTKLFMIVGGTSGDWVLASLIVPVAAALCGYLTARLKLPMLRLGTAAAGAALVLSGLGRLRADGFTHLWRPESALGAVVLVVLWIALTETGRRVQARSARPDDDAPDAPA